MRPQDMGDALIAATAAVHRKTVVTRNVSDFKTSACRSSIRGTSNRF